MTRTDLDDIRSAYALAAERAKRLGADGVEIHAAHGYLLDEFFWSETNLREDEYGGQTLSERVRFAQEVVTAIRTVVGSHFPISLRFSQFKGVAYEARIARTPDELRDFLRVLRSAGVDCFNVSTRRFWQPEWPEQHATLGLAGWTKRLTREVPIVACGSVGLNTDLFQSLYEGHDPASRIESDLRLLESKVAAGEFELVAVGRGHIANHDFVTKIRERRFGDIVPFKRSVHLSGLST